MSNKDEYFLNAFAAHHLRQIRKIIEEHGKAEGRSAADIRGTIAMALVPKVCGDDAFAIRDEAQRERMIRILVERVEITEEEASEMLREFEVIMAMSSRGYHQDRH